MRRHITLQSIEAVCTFLFGLIARLSQPFVILGLMYWAAVALAGIPISIFPWWNLTWAIVQSVAIMAHLAILPPVAYAQAKAGERTNLILTVIALAFLATSCITLLAGFSDPIFTVIRTIALVSLPFTEPTQQQQDEQVESAPLLVGIPVVALHGLSEEAEHPLVYAPVEQKQ